MSWPPRCAGADLTLARLDLYRAGSADLRGRHRREGYGELDRTRHWVVENSICPQVVPTLSELPHVVAAKFIATLH